METYGQGIGNGHEAALAVALHVVFLVADVDDDLAGLWSLDIEVGTMLLVDFRELIARNCGLGDESVSRYFDGLWHFDIRALGLETQVTGYGLTVAAAKFAVACSIEVQFIRTIGTTVRGDHLCGMEGLGEFVNLLLTANTYPLAISLHDVAGIEVHLLGLQLKVATEVVVNLLHHTSPLRVAGVCLTLVHQDTLDDTILLSLLGQSDQPLVGIVVVGFEHAFHPVGCSLDVTLDTVGEESLDVDTADGDMDDTDLDVLGQRCYQCTAKPVCRCQTSIGAAEWGRSLAPLTHFTAFLWEIDGRHQQESGARTGDVLSLRACSALHV